MFRNRLALEKLLTWIPTVCCVCGRSTYQRYALCEDCAGALPWIVDACVQCGDAKPGLALVNDRCGRCLLTPPPFDQSQGLFHYAPPVSRLLTNFKFHGKLADGLCLAGLLAERLQDCWRLGGKPELILAVPLHRARQRQRGFNQALEIARVIARTCQIPMARTEVIRRKATLPQTSMSSSRQRQKNLRGAFVINGTEGLDSVNSVAIVDDVVTTAATVSELAKTLRGHGIRRVQACYLARASA